MNLEKYVLNEKNELIDMSEILRANASINNFFGYKEQISSLIELNEMIMLFVDHHSVENSRFKVSIDNNMSIKSSIKYIKNSISHIDLDNISEMGNFISLNHLALYVVDSSFESTLGFVKSRYMWNKEIDPEIITFNEFITELDLTIAELTFGSSAMLRAKLKKEVCSEFTIKPLFNLIALLDVFFTCFEQE